MNHFTIKSRSANMAIPENTVEFADLLAQFKSRSNVANLRGHLPTTIEAPSTAAPTTVVTRAVASTPLVEPWEDNDIEEAGFDTLLAVAILGWALFALALAAVVAALIKIRRIRRRYHLVAQKTRRQEEGKSGGYQPFQTSMPRPESGRRVRPQSSASSFLAPENVSLRTLDSRDRNPDSIEVAVEVNSG